MKMTNRLVSLAAATVLVASMTGCESTATSDSVSKTGASAQHIRTPSGSVTGTVQDTNGNPLADVTVYLAGKTTTTDAGGVYNFSDVPVTQTNATGANAGQALSVTIAAPTGYIGATVTVTPGAQIDAAETAGATNGIETFIDGYIASAGVAVLPATNSTVSGTLRDTTTGEALASQTIKFEFVSGGTAAATGQEQAQNGVATSYAVSTYTITTDATGGFSFASLPTDSTFNLIVPGYTTDTINGAATTTFASDAEDALTLGNVGATAITALDNVNPTVISVDNTITNGARAILDDDTRNTFVVNFSETLDASKLELAGNSLLLYTGDATNGLTAVDSANYTATIDSASKTVTVTTTEVLSDGDFVDILFLNADVQDTSANTLALDAGIGFDSTVSNYTKLQLQIFQEANTNATQVTVSSQLATDDLGVNDDEAVQAKSNAFNDVLDETAGFQQLNSADNDAGGTIDSQERLDALAQALGATGVTVSQSRIRFTPTNAFQYIVSVADKAGVAKAQGSVAGLNQTTTNVTIDSDFNAGTVGSATITVDDANVVEIYLSNVAPTDVVTITPVDSLGYTGTPATITLVDNVAPTTILQQSYYAAGTAGDNASGTVVQYGDGGELADANGALVVGTPYLAITNSLLDNEDASGELVTTGVTPDETLKTELYDLGVVDTDGTGLIYLDGQQAYDAQAIAAFNQDAPLARKMAVAFSEDLASTGTPVFTGSATINNYSVNNDVTSNVSGQAVNADLIDMDVSNVMTLANTDHLDTITFTGITDEAGNAATAATNAVVVVKDEMAPMALTATYSEATSDVVITFNEPIMLTDSAVAPAVNTKITINGVTATYNAAAVTNQWVLSNSNMTVTIPFGAFAGAINNRTFWTGGALFAYPNDNYSEGATTDIRHRLMDFSAISDALGNSWDSYLANTVGRAVENPLFATAELGSVFGANTPTFGATDTTTNTQTIVWTFSQPVRISNAADIFNGITPNGSGEYFLSGAVPADLVKIQNAWEGAIDPSGANTSDTLTNGGGDTSATLSADRKTITLVFRTTTNLDSGTNDIVRLNTKTIVSEGDTDQSLVTNGLTATAQ